MTLGEYGAIGGIIAGGVALVLLLYGIVCFVHKVNRMERNLQAPLIILTPALIELYRKVATSLFNSGLVVEKEALLDKLGGTEKLTTTDSNRLTQILKDELAQARYKAEQDAVVAIMTLILLVRLLTSKPSRNSG